MTTLYKPVLIESAEQAEALPTGTLARHAAGSGMDHAHKIAPIGALRSNRAWVSLTVPVSNAGMVGWTALIPVEAQEEHGEKATGEGEFVAVARFVTPWEDA